MELRLEDYRRALLAITVAGLVAMLVLPFALGFSVAYATFLPLFVLAAIPALFVPYAAWRRLEGLKAALETVSLGLLLTLPVLVFSYAAMRVGMPLADPLLARLDGALGFDWTAFVLAVDRQPAAAEILRLGYSSFSFQLLFLPILLCIAGLRSRAYQMMLAYFILCTLSAAVALFFPSVGAYVTHGLDPATLRHVNGSFGHIFLNSFHAVRGEPDFVLSIENVAGILTFPSVHTGVAAICAWAAWPSRRLRYPLLVLNVAMAVSTVTHGAHYLVDVLGGGLIALATVALVHRCACMARRHDQPEQPSAPAPMPTA